MLTSYSEPLGPNQLVTENYRLFLYLNTFCTCLAHIQRILIARYSSALSTFQYNTARFLSFCFVKTKVFVPLVLCYEEEGLVGVALPLLIRKYIYVQSYLLLWLTCYLGEPARQLTISSPNKSRPIKQRFLRKTLTRLF